ncbi:MAG: hypothetical protein US49_C0007G0021 [candidate division TM6 bacterium GW2011_GWF2_37_49]|nr:MAG: hypothetical protein US49_C0007G0021 [candidate division TM6 bacterium GW2011_GWF2_37_49]
MNKSNQKFNQNFRWTLTGSLFYEIFKSLHNFLLLNILQSALYGMLGGFISSIFMIVRITDIGLTNSIAPFIKEATDSRQAFKDIILKYYLLLHIPVQIIALCCLPMFTSKFLHINLSLNLFILVSLIIITETLRSFARLVLHTTFKSRITVAIELTSFTIYLLGIWVPIIIFHSKPTITSLLLPLLADSLFSLIFLTIIIIKQIYLPLKKSLSYPFAKIRNRIIKTRLINSILRLSRELFNSNFLTPFFIAKFGLQQAGIFFFAGSLSNSMLAIFRSTMNYPGAALLANLKDAPQHEKKAAFQLLCQKLTLFIAPPIIFCAINFQLLLKMSKSLNLTQNVLALIGLFLTITFSEFFFILYEQFYIVEEASARFLGFKFIEFVLFYIFVIKPTQTSIPMALASIIAIKLVTFILIATDAYITWKIAPVLKSTKKELLIFFIISFATYFLFLKLT